MHAGVDQLEVVGVALVRLLLEVADDAVRDTRCDQVQQEVRKRTKP